MLHRIFYLLSRLAKDHAPGNSPEQLADLWASLLTPATVGPAGRERSRASRVKDYRLVGLLLQHCACIFQVRVRVRVRARVRVRVRVKVRVRVRVRVRLVSLRTHVS